MFRSATTRLAQRISDLIDDMLVGDFDYIVDGDALYADVDYYRAHPHHTRQLTWTPSAGRGLGPQRPVLSGPRDRRPGAVPARPAMCRSSGQAAGSQPATAVGRTRTQR